MMDIYVAKFKKKILDGNEQTFPHDLSYMTFFDIQILVYFCYFNWINVDITFKLWYDLIANNWSNLTNNSYKKVKNLGKKSK